MKKLDISTKKHPDTFCLLDDEDYEWAKYFKWTPEERANGLYVLRGHKNRTIRIHREIVRARAHEQVDHADANGLNNTKKNLRLCSNIQNQQNRTKHSACKSKSGSKYKGVFQRAERSGGKSGRFFAYITINRRRVTLGTFDSDVEAAREYDSKALYYFKEFARLNFSVATTIPTSIQ